MPNRDLKLNSLPRYSKKSQQFVLEEHGHCEVPAGCGGVVLRWRNPSQGIPLQVWIYASGKSELFLDGVAPSSARPIVPWGRHVWSLTIPEIDPRYAALMFAAIYHEKELHIKSTGAPVIPVSILSVADQSWKYTQTEPDTPDWMSLDFDDSHWLPMTPKEISLAAQEKTSRDSYRIRKLQEFGAVALGVSETGTRIWIRKTFSLEAKPGK